MNDRIFISRRGFVSAAGALGLAGATGSLLSACGDSDSTSQDGVSGQDSSTDGGSAGGRVIYAGFGGNFDERVRTAIVEPFTNSTGIEVEMTGDAPPPIGALQTSVEAESPQWNLVILNSSTLALGLDLDLFQDLDYGKIPGADDYAAESYKHPKGAGLWAFSDVLWTNMDVFDEPIQSWADLWDVDRFPGKRGLLDGAHKVLEEAMLSTGIDPADLYPIDLDVAFEQLDKIRPHAVFLDINTLNNQLAQQDVVCGGLNITRIKQAVNDGVPIEYNWNQHLVDVSYYGIPKHAEDVEAVHEFIAYVLSQEIQESVPEQFGYAPATNEALASIPEDLQADLPASPITGDQSVHLSTEWWAEYGLEANERFTNWLQG